MMRRSFLRRCGTLALSGAVLVAFFMPQRSFEVRAAGATLDFSPNSATLQVGKPFTMHVVLNSGGGVGVNAADGTVSFDPQYLTATNVQKENGVFGLWTSDPGLSNDKGTVTFSSGSPTVFTSSGGALLTIVFKPLKEGSTEVSYSAGSALAADGQGTNVLASTGKASFTIVAASASPPPAETTPPPSSGGQATGGSGSGGTPVSVEITSPTHPDPDKWYANKNPEFHWKIPPDVTGASGVLSADSSAVPPRVTEGLIDSKVFNDTADGVWYFALRFQTSAGSWSDTARRKVRVDATPPSSFALDIRNDDPDVPPLVLLHATDSASGIDHYEVKADDRDAMPVDPAQLKDGAIALPPLLPGTHKVIGKAFDRAGNSLDASKDFVISGRSTVEISSISGSLEDGQYFVSSGVADNNAVVSVRIESGSKVVSEETVKADEDGKWIYVSSKPLGKGDYELSAKMTTKAGAESSYTAKQPFSVSASPFMVRFGLLALMFLIFAILALIAYLYLVRRDETRKNDTTKREVDEVRFKTEAVFSALTEEVEEKLQLLDEATATKLGQPRMTPTDLLDKLRDALDISQDTLIKEVDDVEKTLEE